MERYCFVMRIRPGTEAKYERRHDEIWPEMVEALRHAGIRNYTLFRREQEVVGYAECHPDAATAWSRVVATDANRRWQDWFADVIVSRSDGGSEGAYREVWHLE